MAINKNLPDLIEIQRDSFRNFLTVGLQSEINKLAYISHNNLELFLHVQNLKFKKATLTSSNAILNSQTYSAVLYVPAVLVYKKRFKSRVENISFGNIPLMTERGTFIINGSPRVIINQIVRSPGIYYKFEFSKENHRSSVATIIPNAGVWFRIEMDKDGYIWGRFNKAKKIPIFVLLQSLGISQKKIFYSVRHPEFLVKSLEKANLSSTQDALLQLNVVLKPDKSSTLKESMNLIHTNLMNADFYDLGKIGRLKLNKKLHIKTSVDTTILRPEDILAAVNYLINLEYGIGNVDDMDDLKNKRVRSAGELLQDQFRSNIDKVKRTVQYALEKIDSVLEVNFLERVIINQVDSGHLQAFNFKPLGSSLQEFFCSSQLSQFMDETNPLSEITHKRRVSSFGPGGLSREWTGLVVREIHPSHYGRICPIDTPEGQNAGLVGSITTYARINALGFLESPFYRVKKKRVDFNAGILFLSAEQEEDNFLAPGDILLSRSGKLELNDLIPVRYKQEFATAHPEHIDFIAVSPIQMISIATSLIPFLEHDDANRALMGSNMQRQAVPILKNEKPLVGTGLEAQTARDSSSIILAKQSGFVKYVSHDRIVVDTQHDGGKIFNKLKISSYNLENYKRSNQGTCISQKPLVCEHEWVRKGDVLADGSATLNGELALGRNILVAYTPWEGYNFEDAILISNKLVNEQMYTSIHIEKYESRVQHTPLGLEEFTRDLPNVSYSKLSHLGKNGIVLVGTSVKSGDILVGKVTPKSSSDQTPEGRLLRAIFGEKERDVKNTSLKVPSGIEGWVVDVRVFNSNRVQVFLAQKRPIQLGDKVSGRHGNKGIISNILPQQDMPYLQDGTPVDMVLNPLGVPSRMNVGQVLECLLGLAGQHLNESYRITPFDEMYGDETSRKIVYKKLYEAKLKTGKSWLFDPNFPGKTKVIDGRTGETFKQPVTVGYAYILKLVHLVDDKVHARAIGPYSFVTQQPLRGRAKSGGQRLGEMEVWALEGFGAAYTLQELFTVKSDAIEDRKEALNAIVKGQAIPNPGTPESLKVMIRELQSLCLNIGLYTVDQLKQPKKINIFKMK